MATPEPARKARLKIFLGMASGVGKTYAMLQDAQNELDAGRDVVIGAIDHHGRPETMALTAGLDTLPPRTLPFHGQFLPEFDLQNAILRKPQLILLDDLAHANVLGSIHARRWQDVWDLLDAGIDVYTAVNVQHIESLKDVVAQITGVIVRETIPDTILQRADELELVDLPPEELLQRLKEGKVFVPENARHAVDRFYRKGNLMALRELALRRTADHVDADMRRYRSTEGIANTWAASDRLLVCISPAPESANLIRATQRLAERIKAPWLAAYVETGRLRHFQRDRDQIEEHLRLVERLGGETIVLQGDQSLAEDLVQVAKAQNVTRILVGKPGGPEWLHLLRPSLVDRLVRICGDIDVMVLARGQNLETLPQPSRITRPGRFLTVVHVLWAIAVSALMTGLGLVMQMRRFELGDIVMVYVLGILVVGARHGLWPSIATSVMSVGALAFFFVPPVMSFKVADPRHAGTFAILLLMGVVIGNLTERLRGQIRLARVRERRTWALFKLSAELTKSGSSASTVESAIRNVASQFQSRTRILLPDASGRLAPQGSQDDPMKLEELEAAQWAFDHHEAAGLGTETLPEAEALHLPLNGTSGLIGVMSMQPEGVVRWTEPDQQHLLEAFANQTALALEREILAERNAQATRKAVEDDCRRSLLPSVAADLQGPLAEILKAAEALAPSEPGASLRISTHRLQHLMTNLIEMTRLEAGAAALQRQPLRFEPLLETALKAADWLLAGRTVKRELAPTPAIPADPRLVELLLANLLENAATYSPADQPIEIRAWATDRMATLAVIDHGSGLPAGMEERIFDPLVHCENPCGKPGAGLGLALCKRIAEAHGGWIQGSNHPMGGAQFLVSLPLSVGS